ncbi:MAG: hypothetical protein EBS84_04085 [Proteobacteria bacterium]|nr:hypothetical protein [Verrucomicrobiota bacterium]NBU08184.1 hypothetical protein [Pseudomonadota bacterium]
MRFNSKNRSQSAVSEPTPAVRAVEGDERRVDRRDLMDGRFHDLPHRVHLARDVGMLRVVMTSIPTPRSSFKF